MNVYIVRHGQVDSNVKKIYNVEEDLNETGILQAKELAEKIKDMKFDRIYCSPLPRAKHTCEIINTWNLEVEIDERLQERMLRNLAGKSFEETDREEYWNYFSKVKYYDEESVSELCERVKGFLDELKTKQYETVLVVAHSGVSKAFYVYFNGVPSGGLLLDKGLRNGEIKKYVL